MRRDINAELQHNGAVATRSRIEQAVRFTPQKQKTSRVNGREADPRHRIPETAAELHLNLIRAGELLKTPAPHRQWYCYPWFPSKEVILLSGDGGIGKSTLTNQVAISSALGIQWLGHEILKGRTLILSAEDGQDELHYRLEQIAKQDSPYALQDALEALMSIYIIDATRNLDPTLATYDDREGIEPTPLYHAIKAEIQRKCIDLLILDSAADLFAEELNRHAVRSFIRLLRELDCTVILLAHPSASGMRDGRGYSGSTHWNNSVRSRLIFEKPATKEGNELDPDLRILKLAKNNRAQAGTQVFLRWKEGRFVPENASAQSLENLQKAIEVEDLFMQLLNSSNAQGRRVSHNPGPTYAPKVFSEHPSSDGISRKAFVRAQQVLLDAGKIRIVEDGPPSKRRSKLEAAQ